MSTKEQIAEVFALGGGELADEPWDCHAQDPVYGERARRFAFWYEGPPEYAHDEFPDRFPAGSFFPDRSNDASYRTVILDCMFGLPQEVLTEEVETDDGVETRVWRRVAHFTNSGEAECPGRHKDDGALVTEDEVVTVYETELARCPLCDQSLGNPHEFIYIGDGWAEVVYRLDETPAENDAEELS